MNLMEFLNTIPPVVYSTVVPAIISLTGIIFSAKVSAKSARDTAKETITAEVERQKEVWKHERETAYNTEFAEMVTAITLYIKNPSDDNYKRAIGMVNVVRVKERGEFAETLDTLYYLISEQCDKEFYLQQALQYLDNAIKQSREHYCQHAPRNHSDPQTK